jgi:hypothetical protein
MTSAIRRRRDFCASCEAEIDSRPILRMDHVYCCIGCAGGGPCVCLYEQDLADDGVDHLGLPFPMGQPVTSPAPNRFEELVRSRE